MSYPFFLVTLTHFQNVFFLPIPSFSTRARDALKDYLNHASHKALRPQTVQHLVTRKHSSVFKEMNCWYEQQVAD